MPTNVYTVCILVVCILCMCTHFVLCIYTLCVHVLNRSLNNLTGTAVVVLSESGVVDVIDSILQLLLVLCCRPVVTRH
jgi:hypothetical protein